MLTILTPSASAAFNTMDTLSMHWLWNLGCLAYLPTFFLEMISYKLIKLTPSANPSSRLSIFISRCCRLALTQFPKVSFCMSIQFPVEPFTDLRRLLILRTIQRRRRYRMLLNVIFTNKKNRCSLFCYPIIFIHLLIHSFVQITCYLAIHFVGFYLLTSYFTG